MRYFVIGIIFFCVISSSQAVHAAQTDHSATSPSPDAVETDQQKKLPKDEQFFIEIKAFKTKLAEMREELRGLTGEQQLALGLQVRETETQLRELFGDVLQYITEERNKNSLKPYILPQIKSLLQEESKIIQRELAYIEKHIKSLMEGQKDLDALQLFARKQEIGNYYKIYDALLKDFYENAQRLESLELSVADDLSLLDSLLNHRSLTVSSEIKLVLNKLADLREQHRNAIEGDKQKINTKILALEEYKEGLTDSLTVLVNLLQQRKIDATEYSELLIKATGQISSEIFDKQVAFSLFSHAIDDGKVWIKENGLRLSLNLFFVLLILSFFKLLAWLTKRLLQKTLRTKNSRMSNLAGNFLVSMSGKLVMVLGVMLALSQLGFKIGPLLAGLGIAGFIIGFALQDVLSNFASGVMILMYRPFDVGDIIEVPEVSGKVQGMNLVSTLILTFDNQKLVVPNNKIWGNIIRNVHSERVRRVDLVFGIAYEADIDQAEQIFQEILDDHELVLQHPESTIKLHTLGESSMDFIVRPWTKSEDYWTVYWDITKTVKKRLDKEGISIPYPQRDVHIHNTGSTS